MIAATRLRAGNAGSAPSALYAKTVIAVCRRRKVRFSLTTRIDAKIRAACEGIGNEQWIDIRYPQAVGDHDEQRWISDAQIAEPPTPPTAPTRWCRPRPSTANTQSSGRSTPT